MGKQTVYTKLAKIEKKIAAASTDDVLGRWLYGRELLKSKAGRKKLPDGMIDDLVAAADRDGLRVSRREIQYRVRCAEVYVSEAQLRKIICTIGPWSEIIAAGFPEATVDETPSPEAILDAIENGPRTERLEYEQLGMFPEIVKNIPLAEATLRHLVAYAEEMRQMTASYARRDEERREHLRALTAATGGDLDVTYPEAVTALAAQATFASP